MVRRIFQVVKRLAPRGIVPSSPGLAPITPGNGFYGGFVPTSDNLNFDVLDINPPESRTDIVLDSCNIGIQVSIRSLFVNYPPIQIVYRNSSCRFPKLPQPPEKELPAPTPGKADNSCDIGTNIGLINQSYYVFHEAGAVENSYEGNYSFLGHEERSQRVINWNYSYSNPLGQRNEIDYYFKATIVADINFQNNTGYHVAKNVVFPSTLEVVFNEFTSRGWEIAGDWRTNAKARWKLQRTIVATYYFDADLRLIDKDEGGAFAAYLSPPSLFVSDPDKIADFRSNIYSPSVSRYENIFTVREKIKDTSLDGIYGQTELDLIEEGTDFYGKYYSYSSDFLTIRQEPYEIFCAPYQFSPPPIPPPNKMSCCPNVRENDELLRLIAKRLGVTDYPVTVPKVLTDRSKGTETLENITRFTSYVVKQLDALSGKYPIEIEIKDTNITEEGDQTKTIKIPNMAEALAEVIGELLVLRTESDAILNTVIRCLTEAGAAKQSAIIALDYAKANAEFLAYKGKQVTKSVPFTFKPGEPELDKMLVNSEIEVKTFENDDSEDFKDIIEPILSMVAMYRAANFRNLGTADTTTSLKSLLSAFNAFSSGIDEAIKTDNEARNPDNPIKSDFDAFTESAERGFIDKPGITDAANPYNRPLEQRPQIREIGGESVTDSN